MAEPPPAITVTIDGDGGFEIRLTTDPKPVFGRTRAPVTVDVNGYRYRSTVAAMHGGWFVPFRASHRAAAGLEAGRSYPVVLTLDTVPRTVEAPADLAAAIAAAGLDAVWAAWSVTRRREQAEAVAGAKKPDTRARRIAACIALLRADDGRLR